MTDSADDVSRIIDKLADRVDRLENNRESGNEVATTEVIEETVDASDDVAEQYQDVEDAVWETARWNIDTVQ